MIYQYDENGSLIYEAYEDRNGDRTTLEKDGYAAIAKEYNENRKVIKQTYLDESDNPVNCSKGFAIQEYEYDEKNRQTLLVYYDKDGDETQLKKGYSRIVTEYDESGEAVKHYYNRNGNEITP